MKRLFRYFWLEGSDIPAGIGFGLFTWKHFLTLGVCVLGIIFLCRWFLSCSRHGRDIFLKWLSVLMLLGNLARDLFLSVIGRMSVNYLPLHLCSFAIFVYLLYAFLPPKAGKFREALGETGFVLLMPGTVCALLFPDWAYYPIWNFMSLHSFIWHTVLAAFPIMLFLSGRIHPAIRHIWYPVLYLCIVVPPTALFNYFTGCNYLFIMYPLPDTPLEWLYHVMGAWWRVGYAALVLLVILGVYAVTGTASMIRKRSKQENI